jgi:hypothetical protein
MDPIVQVLDGAGKQLAVCDDEPGVWRDARFVFTAPYAGEFFLAVHDTAFGGGGSFPYRLRVTHEPLVWYTFPLVEPKERGADFEIVGIGTDEPVGSPANPTLRARYSATPQTVEVEPNELPTQAQPFAPPIILNGRIERANDLDCFRFRAEKDEKLVFRSATRALGSPCDLVLRLTTAEGKTVAQSDSSLPTDAALTNKFAEAGDYVLEVKELSGNSLPGAPYRIEVRRFESAAEFSAEENRFESAPGGTVSIKLKGIRHEFAGPVRFELWPAVNGISIENPESDDWKNDLELKLKVAEQLAPGYLAHFKIRVTGPSGPAAVVSTRPALGKIFPLMLLAPDALDGLFSVALKPQ